MKIYGYKNFDFSKIKYTNPYKKTKNIIFDQDNNIEFVYYVDIMYNKKRLYIQTPDLKLKTIDFDKNLISFSIDNFFYNNFIECLETNITDTMYTNSEKWFSKKFSREKIKSSMLSVVEVLKDELLLKCTLSNDVLILDKNDRVVDNIEWNYKDCDVVCILCINNICFIKNCSFYNITIEQIKVNTESKSNLDTDSSENLLQDEYFKE